MKQTSLDNTRFEQLEVVRNPDNSPAQYHLYKNPPDVSTNHDELDIINEPENAQLVNAEKLHTARLGACPHILRKPLSFIRWTYDLAFGMVSVILLLAVIAAIPLVNIYALGYFLEVQRRMAKFGKLSGSIPLLDVAPRLGSIALFCWLFLLPLRFFADMTTDAALISPNSSVSRGWNIATNLLALGLFLHISLALSRGGAWYTFFRPIKNFRWLWGQLKQGTYLSQAAGHLKEFVAEFHLREFFSLGFRGLIGAAICLVPPTVLFAVFSTSGKGEPAQGIISLLGGFWLGLILPRLPAIQTHFVLENRFFAWFDRSVPHRNLSRTPLLWLLTTIVFYVLMLPLYLFKIFELPLDAKWMVTIIFVSAILPTKLLIGWVYYFSSVRKHTPPWYWRWSLRFVIYPLCWFYVFMMFFTQYIDERGPSVLFQNHAFFLPF